MTEPPHNSTGTSADAARSVEGYAKLLRERVYELIREAGPLGRTADEVQALTGLPAQTITPRFWELKGNPEKDHPPVRIVHAMLEVINPANGEVTLEPVRRPTRSRRKAYVWVCR